MDVKKPRISDVDGRLRIGVFSTVTELLSTAFTPVKRLLRDRRTTLSTRSRSPSQGAKTCRSTDLTRRVFDCCEHSPQRRTNWCSCAGIRQSSMAEKAAHAGSGIFYLAKPIEWVTATIHCTPVTAPSGNCQNADIEYGYKTCHSPPRWLRRWKNVEVSSDSSSDLVL